MRAVAAGLAAVTSPTDWGLPVGLWGSIGLLALWVVAGGTALLAGFSLLRGRAVRTRNEFDDILVTALRWPVLTGWLLIGLYLFVEMSGAFSVAWERRLVVVLLVAISLTVAHGAARLSVCVIERRAKTRPSFRSLKGILEFVVRLGMYSIAILVVLDHLDVEITPLLGAFGIGGLAVALALQDTLSNFFAGLYLTVDRPLREGDFVEVDGGPSGKVSGFVVAIGWRNVRIRELSNNVFVIPNTRLASGIIKNYDLPEGEMSVVQQCSVAYGSDLAKVERVVVEVAKECQTRVQGAVPEHDPFIRYHTFGDDGIKFSIILRVRTFVDQYLMVHEFVKALHGRFEREGIVIPFPQRTLHFDEAAPVEIRDDRSGNGGRNEETAARAR